MRNNFVPAIIVFLCSVLCIFLINIIVKDYVIPILNNTISDLPEGKVYTSEDMDEKFRELINSDTQRYAYTTLSDDDRKVYDKILNGVCAFADRIDIQEDNVTMDELRTIYTCLRNDYPEIFWIYNKSEVYCSGDIITDFIPYYLYDKESSLQMADSLIEIRDTLISPITNKSDYEKVMYIFDYIVDYTEYDTASYTLFSYGKDSDELELSCNIYGTLMKGKALCEGYSKTLQFLLNSVGLDCIYITGQAGGEGHAWNYVYLGDSYYAIDITWCDPQGSKPIKSYAYCLIDDDTLAINHQSDLAYALPKCEGGQYNWFKYNGYELTAYDVSAMTDMFYKAYLEGRNYVEIHCAGEAVYNEVIKCIENQQIFMCFDKIENATGRNYDSISYELIDDVYSVIIEIGDISSGSDTWAFLLKSRPPNDEKEEMTCSNTRVFS